MLICCYYSTVCRLKVTITNDLTGGAGGKSGGGGGQQVVFTSPQSTRVASVSGSWRGGRGGRGGRGASNRTSPVLTRTRLTQMDIKANDRARAIINTKSNPVGRRGGRGGGAVKVFT